MEEELQWARILVKKNGEFLPSVLEIGVEEDVYSLALWWELRPSLRKAMVDNRETTGRKSGEVWGDDSSHVGSRVKEELGKARLEALLLPVDGMGAQESGLGREVTANCAQGSATQAFFEALVFGPPSSGPIMGSKELKRAGGLFMQCPSKGLKLKGVVAHAAGPKAGPLTKWWAVDVDCPTPVGLADLDEVNQLSPRPRP